MWTIRVRLILFDRVDINISKVFFLVVLTLKLRPWESCRVQYERASWEALMNLLYIIRYLRESLFVQSMGVQ